MCLQFADARSKVEQGCARDRRKAQGETTLRFNLADVEAAAEELQPKGVAVAVRRFDWGVVGAFGDPDGNACELTDAPVLPEAAARARKPRSACAIRYTRKPRSAVVMMRSDGEAVAR